MQSPLSGHEIRLFGNGRVSPQGGEEIGRVHRTLNAASLRKLKTVKPINTDVQPASRENDTNRGVCEVIADDAQSARRDLSERRVAEAELLDQESIVTEQSGGVLRARERCDRVSLGIGMVRLYNETI
jgi:hypothetical protein